MMFFATLLVVFFSVIAFTTTSVYAADAAWKGNDLVYAGNTYTGPIDTSKAKGLSKVVQNAQVYQFVEKSGTKQIAHLIYFDAAEAPKSAKEATYVTYTLNPPNDYSSPSKATIVTINLSNQDTPEGVSKGTSSCNIDGAGWWICPLGNWISDAVDNIYNVIASFLTVQPITGGNNSLYRMWDIVRDIANITFIIGFIVVIYRYITGTVADAYTIRKIIPRIFIAAILVNISYWLCSIAVDVSNILGYSIQALFVAVRDSTVGTEVNTSVSWAELWTYVASGGTIGALGFYAATGGSIASFGFIVVGVLITVAFAALVALIVLAARQALVLLFVIISPLAFAANILPNTEDWFAKWRKAFVTLLLVFPIFSAIFGGAQLASVAIIQNATNLAMMILGMAVKIVPLAITPLLIQFSGNLVGRIAGMVNNPGKGMVDRAKGWTQGQADYHKARALSGESDRLRPYHKPGQWMNRRKMGQEDKKKNYETAAQNRYHASRRYEKIDTQRRDLDLTHQTLEAKHDTHWKQRLDSMDEEHYDKTLALRQMKLQDYQDQGKQADASYEAMREAAKTYDPNDQAQIERLRARGLTVEFDDSMRIASKAAKSTAYLNTSKEMAERVLKSQMVTELRADDNDIARKLAGGVHSDGALIARARATRERTQIYGETLEAIKSDMSNNAYTLKDTYDIIYNGGRIDPATGQRKASTETEIHAAMDYLLNDVGNMWSSLKLRRHVARNYKITDDDDASTKQRKLDMQQIYKSLIMKSALKPTDLSGTDLGLLETGQMGNDDEFAFIENMANGDKIKAQHFVSADIDELSHWLQIAREESQGQTSYRLSAKGRSTLINKINEALTDPLLKKDIGGRQARMMHALRNQLSGTPDESMIRPGMAPDTFTVNVPFEPGQGPSDDRREWDNIDDGFDPFDPSLFPPQPN